MKALYWKTRPLRRTSTGGRQVHWPGLALNLALALAMVAVPLCGAVLIDLEFNVAESLPLFALALPVILTWALALTALGFGFRLTAPLDCLPGEHGEPPVQRTTRWFHWANLRAVLFGVLAGVTVLLLCFTLSNWQGRRAWEAYRADAVKRGVVFDLEKLMPPPVPDAENFATTPLLLPFQSGRREFDQARATNQNKIPDPPLRTDDPRSKEPVPREENWLQGQRLDLAAWQAHHRASTNFPKWSEPRSPAEDVLKALSRFDREFTELHAAAARPLAHYNVHLTEDGASTLLPHLYVLRRIASTATLRAAAEIATGRTDEAFADTKLIFRAGDSLMDEPILISHLVRLAMHTTALRTLWEGLADHRWSEAQLAHFQAELAKRNLAAEVRQGMAGERAFGNRIIEYLRRRPDMLHAIGGPEDTLPGPSGGPGYHVIPSGWFYREQISYNQMFDEFIVTALPTEAGKFDPALIQAKSAAMKGELHREHRPSKAILRHRVLSNLLLPALEKAMHRACQAQAFTELAIAACALERHRLARGSYPESLAALAPEFGPLPPDPMSGQPFRYERTADGRFRLWSLGWNGKDDGGQIVLHEVPKDAINFEQGDWVWPVPAK